jgi:hypothetical protein
VQKIGADKAYSVELGTTSVYSFNALCLSHYKDAEGNLKGEADTTLEDELAMKFRVVFREQLKNGQAVNVLPKIH